MLPLFFLLYKKKIVIGWGYENKNNGEQKMKTYDAGISIILLAALIGWGVSYLGNRAVAGEPVPTYCERYVERVTDAGRELVCEAKGGK